MKRRMEKNAKKLNEGKTRNWKLQNEIPKQYIEEGSNCLKCNSDLKKTLSIFGLMEKIIETWA